MDLARISGAGRHTAVELNRRNLGFDGNVSGCCIVEEVELCLPSCTAYTVTFYCCPHRQLPLPSGQKGSQEQKEGATAHRPSSDDIQHFEIDLLERNRQFVETQFDFIRQGQGFDLPVRLNALPVLDMDGFLGND